MTTPMATSVRARATTMTALRDMQYSRIWDIFLSARAPPRLKRDLPIGKLLGFGRQQDGLVDGGRDGLVGCFNPGIRHRHLELRGEIAVPEALLEAAVAEGATVRAVALRAARRVDLGRLLD